MQAYVIPFSHSLTLEPYTYEVPSLWRDAITLGCLVSIPFGKSIESGIVVGITKNPEEFIDIPGIREIETIITSYPLLSPYQIEMLYMLARRYCIPLFRLLRVFLPTPLMNRLEKNNYALLYRESIGDHIPGVYTIEHYRDRAFSREQFVSDLRPGSVYIFPDDYFLSKFVEGTDIESCMSESTPVRKSKFWMEVFEGKYPIIAGTRKLLYYNLSRYEHISYIEDAFGDLDYQYPLFLRNLDILRALSDPASHISVRIISSTPTLELFAKFRDYTIITHT